MGKAESGDKRGSRAREERREDRDAVRDASFMTYMALYIMSGWAGRKQLIEYDRTQLYRESKMQRCGWLTRGRVHTPRNRKSQQERQAKARLRGQSRAAPAHATSKRSSHELDIE